jgi:hypothetical protein
LLSEVNHSVNFIKFAGERIFALSKVPVATSWDKLETDHEAIVVDLLY